MITWTHEFIAAGELPPQLLSLWSAQVELSGNIFQHPDIVMTWCETMGKTLGGELIVLRATSDQGHTVVLPLWHGHRTMNGLKRRVLEGIGGRVQYDYQNPLVLGGAWDEGTWNSFWRGTVSAVAQRFPRLVNIEICRLSVPVPEEFRFHYYDQEAAPYLDVLPGPDALELVLNSCGSSHRSNVRRRMRDAAKIGTVSVEKIAADSIEVCLNEMFNTHVSQWRSKGTPSQFESESFRAFFTRLCLVSHRLGKLHFSRLRVGEEVWHWLIAFVHRGELLWYKPTYVLGHEKRSPGLVHLACLIQQAGQEGITRIDFGYGGEQYKFLWTKNVVPLHGIRAENADVLLKLMQRLSYYLGRLRVQRRRTADTLQPNSEASRS